MNPDTKVLVARTLSGMLCFTGLCTMLLSNAADEGERIAFITVGSMLTLSGLAVGLYACCCPPTVLGQAVNGPEMRSPLLPR